jgi:formylglycine-generating enzyme required for sulfatase activity
MGFDDVPEESPKHTVRIERAFAISLLVVTRADWKRCVVDGACTALGAVSKANREPALVGWIDAQQYIGWLSAVTGADYRLLSEAEWEYVATASKPAFESGGLEWTSDCWHADYRGAPVDGSSWAGRGAAGDKANGIRGDCHYHVARGRPSGTASALTRRYHYPFDARDGTVGFRVARTLSE